MATLFVKSRHPEIAGKLVTVKVEVEPGSDYTVKGATVFEENESERPLGAVTDIASPDTFSKVLLKHGFDENEVRFEIEDIIHGLSASDTLL